MYIKWKKGLRGSRREKTDIMADLLEAIRLEQAKFPEGGAVLTRVQYRLRVPYTRFRVHLNEAIEAGLVRMVSKRLFVTRKGEEFLESYDRVANLVERQSSEDTGILPNTLWR